MKYCFKALTKSELKWVEGQLEYCPSIKEYIIQETFDPPKLIYEKDLSKEVLHYSLYHEVDQSSICQYIGIDDSNKNKIYSDSLLKLGYKEEGDWDYFVKEYLAIENVDFDRAYIRITETDNISPYIRIYLLKDDKILSNPDIYEEYKGEDYFSHVILNAHGLESLLNIITSEVIMDIKFLHELTLK